MQLNWLYHGFAYRKTKRSRDKLLAQADQKYEELVSIYNVEKDSIKRWRSSIYQKPETNDFMYDVAAMNS